MSIGKALTRSLKVLSRNPKSEQNRERGAAHSRLLSVEVRDLKSAHVRLWHKADVQTALMNVRFEGNNGHDADRPKAARRRRL